MGVVELERLFVGLATVLVGGGLESGEGFERLDAGAGDCGDGAHEGNDSGWDTHRECGNLGR